MKKREAERRIAMTQAEISAALAMTIAIMQGKPKPRVIRYQLGQAVRCFAYLAEALDTGNFAEYGCESCGKPIRPGQHYVNYEDGVRIHARCNGFPKSKCDREPTRRQVRLEARAAVKDAKAFMKAKGIPEVSTA